MTYDDAFGHEWHPWLGRTVMDIPSKGTGRLMAVVYEQVCTFGGQEHWVRLAYIRPASGIEWSTALGNISLLS
ncbi:hypothetical protein BX286_5041 [Streptomyces sp. 3211.6]|uniref:hypothetical protein n=1 Tax=Streptomyces TaxID=1883 RepID=UPI000C2B7733|nr:MULTISPECIES: hypothetical protein [Streptomyces]RKT06993.1 hypothetical protein BX286_5041 [Streptomyces sp. 3211.6]RPF45398.1 hypothetical protein EDD96_1957 [Streptomyces sp. Ag109_G2-6]